jgi:hypothetical protein
LIIVKSSKYGLSPRIFTAILMQESGYKLDAKNIQCGVSIETGEKDCVVVDFGLGQINYKTIVAFNLDRHRLLKDLEYSVEASAKVLYDFKKSHPHESTFWTRYNASSFEKRETYRRLVSRYM